MKLKPYPKYRDSGVPWLGDVPEHWEIHHLKRMAKNIVEITTEKSPLELYVALEHIESGTGYLRRNRESSFQGQVKRFSTEDILFGKLRPYLAKVTLPNEQGVCVGEILVIRPNGKILDKLFVAKAIMSQSFIDIVNSSTYGAKMPRAEWTFIGSLGFPKFPIEEQQQIARYLDWKTAQINKFIRNKRRLIQLLKEQKQNIINQAVTKGINPNVEMKDSGVEWLGQIPAHWEVRKLKYIATMKSGDNLTAIEIEEQGQYPVYGGNGIRGYYDKFNWSGSFILVGRQGALCGNVHRVRGSFWATEHAVVTIPKKDICLDWYYYMLVLMNLNQYSEAAAQPGISVEKIQKLRTAVPPLNEQEQIALFIEKETALIDKTIARTELEIELIQEYRSRLVSDVVTGKLDVRGIEIPDFEPVEADLELEEDEESEGEEIDEDE